MDISTLTIFVQKHLLLTVSFFLVFMAILLQEFLARSKQAKLLLPHELVMAMNADSPTIIELREIDAYKKAYILSSKQVEPTELKPAHFEKFKQKKLILVCDNGAVSRNFANKLKQLGWVDVSSLAGGTQAWRESGLPFEKK